MTKMCSIIVAVFLMANLAAPQANAVVVRPTPPDRVVINLSQPSINPRDLAEVEINGESKKRLSGLLLTVSKQLEVVTEPSCVFYYYAVVDKTKHDEVEELDSECFVEFHEAPNEDTVIIATISTSVALTDKSILVSSTIEFAFDVELRSGWSGEERPHVLVLTGYDADGGVVRYFI
jgi:hypothetical protein